MAMTSDFADRADSAVAKGDLEGARALLEQLAAVNPTAENWLKLGSICRATGDSEAALKAVHNALAINPLDFMGLLSRAVLLEQLDPREAGEAWGRALAQRPNGQLPPQIDRMVAHAEVQHQEFIARRSHELAKLLQAVQDRATAEESARIDRFRSNALRTTKVWHSEPTHFHFPGLVEREFHDETSFAWLEDLEAATDKIAAECAALMKEKRAVLVPYIQYGNHEPLGQWRELNHSLDWTAIHLLQNGERIEANAQQCPQTMALLAKLPQPDIPGCSPNAMFSLLAPGATIPPHNGVTNTRLVCHLPLFVPEGCWFRVGAVTRLWQKGRAWVFDDTIEHEAANPSSALRIILIVDVWHPGLSAVERDAVTSLLATEARQASLAL